MNFEEFKHSVEQWAKERGIYEHSTPEAQLLKTLSELGEVADAVIKNNLEGIKDGIGDVAVCLVNYAFMTDKSIGFRKPIPYDGVGSIEAIGEISISTGQLITESRGSAVYLDYLLSIALENNLQFMDCCEHAWNEIKDRKGRMVPGGAFVKDD